MSEGLERVSLDKNLRHPMVVIREHLIRYTFALQNVFDKDVLDVACGTGYGTYLMSYWAKSVTGYDNDKQTIKGIKRNFQMRAPAFLEARDLDIETNLGNNLTKDFDVVTCFETLEHLENPEQLILSIKKHLRPNGVFYFSTPNKPDLVDNSKWHKSVFNWDIWDKLLTKYFPNKQGEIWGQDQYGLTKDKNKPYIVGKVQPLCKSCNSEKHTKTKKFKKS